MTFKIRSVWFFLALMAALMLIPAALGPSPSSDGPYLSSISDLAVGQAFAAPPNRCQNKVCDGNIPPKCLNATGYNCPVQGNRCATNRLC